MSGDALKLQGHELPRDGGRYLPHRPPMRFVDRLLERVGERAVGSAVVPAFGICCDGQRLFPEYFVEIVAQTVAMANGYDAALAGTRMRDGMLVGIDAFRFSGSVAAGTELRIVTEKSFSFGAVRIIHGEIFAGDRMVAWGDIKVWEDLG